MSNLFRLFLVGILLIASLEIPVVFAQVQTDCAQTSQDGDCEEESAGLLVTDCVQTSQDRDCIDESASIPTEIGNVADTVNSLRSALAKEQNALLEELARGESTDKPSTPLYNEYVERLRGDLRNIALEQSLVSGDVDLALRKATIRHLTERIAAYEAAYGQNDGVFTTRYNVLTDADLVRLEKQVKTRLHGILKEAAVIPESDLTTQTQGQIIEIRRELDALRFERSSRTYGPPRLVSLDDTPTASDPEAALDAIQKAESAVAAERALLVEIELRSTWNPDDAALSLVKQNIMFDGPYREYFLALIKNGELWRNGWPPSRGPPPDAPSFIRGPDPYPIKPEDGGAAKAIAEVRENIALEIEAIRTRDPLGRADAAAHWNVASHWLNDLIGAQDNGWQTALAVLSETDLENHLVSLQELKVAFAKETSSLFPDLQRVLEIDLVDERLVMLKNEIWIRGPPPPGLVEDLRGPQAIQRAAELSFEASSQPPYEEYAEKALESRRLVELKKLETIADTVDKATIKEALEIQSKVVSDIYAATVEAERIAFVHGRGSDGVLTAVRYGNAKRAMQEAGDSLRQQANGLVMNGLMEADVFNSITEGLPPKPTVSGSVKGSISLSDHLNLVKQGTHSLPQPHITFASTRVPLAEATDQLRFDSKFTLTGPNSAEAFRKNPILAPGGVIVDLMLPEASSEQLTGIRYNNAKKQFEVKIDGKWLPVDASISPQTARAALGFVFDKRVAVIDIGSFDKDTKNWMVRKNIIPDIRALTDQDKESLKKLENVLRVVRSNPAIADTEIAPSLMAADELIFSALSLDEILLAKHTVFRGMDTVDLHQRLNQDKADVQNQSTGYKSVLTVDNSTVTLNETGLHVHPQFDYAVYVGETKLERVSVWFNDRDDELRSVSPELRRLEEFSIAVAVIRSAVHNGLDDGLDSLAYIYEPGRPSPSLICHSDVPAECEEPFIKYLTNYDSNYNIGGQE